MQAAGLSKREAELKDKQQEVAAEQRRIQGEAARVERDKKTCADLPQKLEEVERKASRLAKKVRVVAC